MAYISSEIRGLFGNIFCDFGPAFTVFDTTGEEPASCMVSSITQELKGLVTVSDDTRHGLETGDFVSFSGLQGMDQLNEMQPQQIEVCSLSLYIRWNPVLNHTLCTFFIYR